MEKEFLLSHSWNKNDCKPLNTSGLWVHISLKVHIQCILFKGKHTGDFYPKHEIDLEFIPQGEIMSYKKFSITEWKDIVLWINI